MAGRTLEHAASCAAVTIALGNGTARSGEQRLPHSALGIELTVASICADAGL